MQLFDLLLAMENIYIYIYIRPALGNQLGHLGNIMVTMTTGHKTGLHGNHVVTGQ